MKAGAHFARNVGLAGVGVMLAVVRGFLGNDGLPVAQRVLEPGL